MTIVDKEAFLQQLAQLYAGTRKWGTVRLQLKRVFEEVHRHKKSKRAERAIARDEQCKLPGDFPLSVKAATPKRRLSTVVQPADARDFEAKLSTIMNAAMFKRIVETKQKKGKPAKEAKAVPKRETAAKIKKNRKERRKDVRKATRKVNRAKKED